MAKGIPYGISDFSRLIDQNYYYVDKTHFIPQIEEIANYLFLIRPRRFGKSVFLTMMPITIFHRKIVLQNGSALYGSVSTPPRFRESTRCSILTFPKQTWDVEVWKTTSTIIAAYS